MFETDYLLTCKMTSFSACCSINVHIPNECINFDYTFEPSTQKSEIFVMSNMANNFFKVLISNGCWGRNDLG